MSVKDKDGDESYDEDDDDYDDWEEDEEFEEAPPKPPKKTKKSSGKSSPKKEISDYLDLQTTQSLKELILSLVENHPDVQSDLLDRARIRGGATEKLVDSMRREMDNIIAEPDWDHRWPQGGTGDFSRVESTMGTLLDQGQYDAVIDIAKELMSKANSFVECCYDDEDFCYEISDCMDIVFEAVKKCAWPDLEKALFALDAKLNDEYDLCEGASKVLNSIKDKSVWSQVADELEKKLDGIPISKDESGWRIGSYQRDRLSNMLMNVLEKSGRAKEILPLYKKEAPITASWERYVDRLIHCKQFDEARKAAEEGMKQTPSNCHGTKNSLRERVVQLAQKSGDVQSVLRLKQETFLECPGLDNYSTLLEAAVKTKNQGGIRTWALKYLKTGKVQAAGALKKPIEMESTRYTKFPDYCVLIDIAEKEKEPDKVLYWYREAIKKDCRFGGNHVQVAHAIGNKFPDEALKIWRNLAEEQIDLTKPSAYDEAVGYLKKARDIYTKTGRKKEWTHYLEGLLETNKRKIRFIEKARGI